MDSAGQHRGRKRLNSIRASITKATILITWRGVRSMSVRLVAQHYILLGSYRYSIDRLSCWAFVCRDFHECPLTIPPPPRLFLPRWFLCAWPVGSTAAFRPVAAQVRANPTEGDIRAGGMGRPGDKTTSLDSAVCICISWGDSVTQGDDHEGFLCCSCRVCKSKTLSCSSAFKCAPEWSDSTVAHRCRTSPLSADKEN